MRICTLTTCRGIELIDDQIAPFDLIQISEPRVVQITLLPTFHTRSHGEDLATLLGRMISTAPNPLHLLIDLRQAKMDWSDLIGGLVDIRDVRRTLKNPEKYRGLLVVTTCEVLKLGAKALTQQQGKGSASVMMFDTVDAAVQFAANG